MDPTHVTPLRKSTASSGLARARAMRALAIVGLSADGLQRADSVTNEVWLTDEYVVRVNRDASLRLHREAVLSQVLPHAVGYPDLVQHGGAVGSDWLILRRMPGEPLSRAWPTLDEVTRRRAVSEFAQRLRAVHGTPCPSLDGLHDVPQLLDPAPTGHHAIARLLHAIDEVGRFDNVDAGVLRDVGALARSLAPALDPFDQDTVVHGDLSFENVLWDGHEVTGLIDFEFARPGPPDLDLDVLLRFLAYPHLHVSEANEAAQRAEDYAAVPWWLAEDYPELFVHPLQFDRVRLYSISWDIKELLAFPPQVSPQHLDRQHPYQRLLQLLRGTSYLDRFNGSA